MIVGRGFVGKRLKISACALSRASAGCVEGVRQLVTCSSCASCVWSVSVWEEVRRCNSGPRVFCVRWSACALAAKKAIGDILSTDRRLNPACLIALRNALIVGSSGFTLPSLSLWKGR